MRLDYMSQCSHHKVTFCSNYEFEYRENWENKAKLANERKYFSNFDLFNLTGIPFDKEEIVQIEPYSNNPMYMYQVNWADSFYLYYYESPYIYWPCVCDKLDAPYTDSFELERPLWKFYKINDTTYFSTRLMIETRDSFLHTPSQIFWKRSLQNCYRSGKCNQRYRNHRAKKSPFVYTYRLLPKDTPKDLFWEIANNKKPKLKKKRQRRFSMDSLIRSFQK